MPSKTELNSWKMLLTVSHRKHKPAEDARKIYKDYYRGNQWLNADIAGRFLDQVVDNIVFQNVRAIVPRLNTRRPRIFVTPKKKPYKSGGEIIDTNSGAIAMEILLEWYYKHLRVKRSSRKCLYDALIGFWGIMELGYTLKTEKVYIRNNKRELINTNEIIKENEVFVRRRNPDDFRRDPEGEDLLLQDDRWIALRFCHSLEEIKQNSIFENTKGLKSNFTVKTDYGANSIQEKNQIRIDMHGSDYDPNMFKKVEGWWVWDKKKRKRMAVVDNHPKFLAHTDFPTWMDNIDGFPVETMYLNENPDEGLPVADLQIYKKVQDEINMIGSYQLSHIKRVSQRRYVVNDGAMETSEEIKLQHGTDGVVVNVKGNPSEKIMALQDAGISQDIYMIQRQKKQEAAAAANVPETDKGMARNFETATEPALINAGSQTIREDQRGLFENFTNRIISKMSLIIQKTMDTTSVPLNQNQFDRVQRVANNPRETPQTINFIASKLSKIVGPEKEIWIQPWFNLKKKDIQGDYDYNIEVGSTQPVNQEIRKRDTMALVQALQGNPWIRQKEATEKILEVFERKDAEELMKTQEEFDAEMKAQSDAASQPEPKDQLKVQADLQKTQLKVAAADKMAREKNQTALRIAILNSVEEDKKE